MKALSLFNPHAYLCCIGAKTVETRSFNTQHRGKLYIHASKNTSWAKSMAGVKPFVDFMPKKDGAFFWDDLAFGAIIGSVELIATVQFGTPMAVETFKDFEKMHGRERLHQEFAFGNYNAGRWGWFLKNPILFTKPIPCKGSLSIWTVPEEVQEEIKKELYKDGMAG